ncbi:MAG: hypothetical protein FRX49_09633 [Trebouxia sp. A1-2]|nr:MAG: hypothetical protein FRX49_09633 [Trebouxia sp. A1-2]
MMHAGYPGQHTDTRASVDCKYFLEGRCSLGDACPFRHRAELFNTAARARAALAPHSQPIVCHFYLNGKCTKGASCAFQHPQAAAQPAASRPAVQPQEEMQIDFEDDESPRQPEQTRHAKPVAPRPPPVQARLGPKLQQAQPGQRRGEEQVAPQPVHNRLGGQPGVQRRADPLPMAHRRQSTSADQDDKEKAKGSVFQRLSMSRPGTPLNRLSSPSVPADSKPTPRPTARPTDARELLVQTMTAKARVGRKEAELVRPGAVRPDLATRRVVAVNRGAKGTPVPAPVHAPKFASPATSEGTGPRKSALERIQLPQTSPASSARTPVSNPATAAKPRRASVVPFTSSRLKPSASSSQSPAQTPSQAETPSVTPAAGPSAAPGPNPEQSTGGTDRRGRQKITWQPPTASQKESDAQEARANLSKRKASDAASPALDTAAAAAADELSPSKRIKAQAAPTDKQATSAPKSAAQPVVHDPAQPAVQLPVQQPQAKPAAAAAADASEGQQQIDILEELQDVDSILDEGEAQLDYADQASDCMGDLLDEAADDDVLFEDDFDDEATMRELEALG